jgi:hypothetical protein
MIGFTEELSKRLFGFADRTRLDRRNCQAIARGASVIGAGLILLAFSLTSVARAEDAPKIAHYLCYRTTDDRMKIDGNITDTEWSNAPWTSDFVDIVGKSTSPKPAFVTRAKMLWSDTTLYIAAHLDETNIVARIKDHDGELYTGNAFEVFIDPDADNQNYVELEINAANTTMDLTMDKPYRDRGKPDLSFELTGLKTAVHVDGTLNDASDTDRGWDVEIAIPFAALEALAKKPSPNEQWRINLARSEYIDENTSNYSVWSPQGEKNMHAPERFGYMQFTNAPPGKGEFKPDPTANARLALFKLYHAERAYRYKNKHWATTLKEMNFTSDLPIDLKATPQAWIGTVTLKEPKPVTISVDQDSHVRVESKTAP